MESVEPIVRRALEAGGRYEVALDAFASAYARAIAAPDALAQSGMDRLARELTAIADSVAITEDRMIEEACLAVAREAQGDATRHLGHVATREDDSGLEGAIYAASARIWAEFDGQLGRDVAQTNHARRIFALRTTVFARAKGWAENSARMALVVEEGRPAHRFLDRAGRRRPSAAFIRTLWRDTLLDLYNRTYLLILAAHGETEARVWHRNPQHRYHGQIIALDDAEPRYDDLRELAFHPNAEALVRSARFYEENFA